MLEDFQNAFDRHPVPDYPQVGAEHVNPDRDATAYAAGCSVGAAMAMVRFLNRDGRLNPISMAKAMDKAGARAMAQIIQGSDTMIGSKTLGHAYTAGYKEGKALTTAALNAYGQHPKSAVIPATITNE